MARMSTRDELYGRHTIESGDVTRGKSADHKNTAGATERSCSTDQIPLQRQPRRTMEPRNHLDKPLSSRFLQCNCSSSVTMPFPYQLKVQTSCNT